MKIISRPEDFLKSLDRAAHPNQDDYVALYATWLDGVVTHPPWMVIALDDHLVHRGDGVFEVVKCVDGGLYLFPEHLERFRQSADALSLDPPPEFDRLEEIIKELIRLTGLRDCVVHLYLSRGPGDLSVDPAGSYRPQLAALISHLSDLPTALVEQGAKAIIASIPAKPLWQARIKAVDYLQNILLQLEANAAGVKYAFALSEDGVLAEGPTVSAFLVTPDKALIFPREGTVLKGLTKTRLLDLAQVLVAEGVLARVGSADLSRDDLFEAREIMVSGTVTNLIAVRELDGRPIGTGRPGPVFSRLRELLLEDVRTNSKARTEVY